MAACYCIPRMTSQRAPLIACHDVGMNDNVSPEQFDAWFEAGEPVELDTSQARRPLVQVTSGGTDVLSSHPLLTIRRSSLPQARSFTVAPVVAPNGRRFLTSTDAR